MKYYDNNIWSDEWMNEQMIECPDRQPKNITEQTKPRFDRLLQPPAWNRSGYYSGRKGRDGQKKK